MAQIPDTPDIATALSFVNVSSLPSADIAKVTAAVARLRVLHTLGATDDAIARELIRDRDAARAERDARPTAEALKEAETERDALRVELEALRNPPVVGPYSVPIVQFRAGLIGLRLALLSAPDTVRAKWGVILPELEILREVYPREAPVTSLLDEAVNDGLISAEYANTLRGF